MRRIVAGTVVSCCVVALVVFGMTRPAQAATRQAVMANGASYARHHGYTVGIAVLDTRTGHLYGSGRYNGVFASESVVKVFIATRLLVSGQMHGTTKARAYKMITRSDDAIATSLYGRVGGDGLIGWMKKHFHVAGLGYRPSQRGWWGNTHIRPAGLVRLYAKLKANRRVGPWLLNAMHHATKYGSDGTYQFFGLPSATRHAAVKQGWGNDFEIGNNADFNTTGFVNNDRYAVAILARGPISSYGSGIGGLLTNVARRLLPGGRFPAPVPKVTGLSKTSGRVAGGSTVVVRGSDLTGVRAVHFGARAATHLERLSATRIRVVAPGHSAGTVNVRVITSHGSSHNWTATHYTYVGRPRVRSVAPAAGPVGGGTVVTVTGINFRRVTGVRFGSTPARSVAVRSAHELRVVAPAAGKAGPVDITVTTGYGGSPVRSSDRFSYGG
jgi:hypothetical protein